VYGEDDETRATPPTVRELFAVRRNYFRLYFHYMYFNIARILYLQVDNVFGLFLLFPSIVAGTITLGLMTQITNVFGQVRGSFQYLISSWTTLVELMSIYKRLRSFERELDGKELQLLPRRNDNTHSRGRLKDDATHVQRALLRGSLTLLAGGSERLYQPQAPALKEGEKPVDVARWCGRKCPPA
jgi:ABC-type uncharacterized transport system fused permease/ATPase subunit